MTALNVADAVFSGRAPAAEVASGRRIAELDGLRGLAAIVVVVAHYFGEVPSGLRALTGGWIAVDVFFVLSGFLIGSIILENRRAPNFLTVFFIRRACRILPCYLATVSSVLIVIALLGSERSWIDPPLPALSYLSLTQNVYMAWTGVLGSPWLMPTWTVTVEEQFYLVAPLLIVLIPARHLVKAIVAGMAAALLFRAALVGENEIATLVLLPGRWDLLLAGILAAVICREGWLTRPEDLFGLRLLPLLCVSALLLVLLLDPGRESGWFGVLSPLLMGIGVASFIAALVSGGPEGQWLRSEPLRFFGTISYGLYLSHQPVAGLLHGVILDGRPDIGTLRQLAVTVLALLVSIGLAWASWRAFERPLVQFGRRWDYRPA